MRRILRLGSMESPSRSLRSKLKGERWMREETYQLLYHGCAVMTDLRSPTEAVQLLQLVKQTSSQQRLVLVSCRGTELSVVDAKDEQDQLLSCSLLSVAQCIQESSHGFNDCIAVSYTSGAWAGQCHVFQAKTPREAADIAHSLQKHVKFALRLTGRKRTDTGTMGVAFTPTLQRGFSDSAHQLETPPTERRLSVSRTRKQSTVVKPGSPTQLMGSIGRDTSPTGRLSAVQPPVSPRSRKLFRKQREMSKLERLEQVLKASISVEDSCVQLHAACRKPHAQSPFEKVLCAIGSSDMFQLRELLDQKLLGIDSCDHDGNTLMHYAVSAGSIPAVRILANRMASLNGPNVFKTRPLHRAVAVGKVTMAKTLLDLGANVNAADNRNWSPLHLAAARGATHSECVWLLLEHGASIGLADTVGVRPLDLLPGIKDMQTRLVTSVCKSFADPQERGMSPSTASPYLSSSPSSSLRVHGAAEYGNQGIEDLVHVVQDRARSLRSRALARRTKSKVKNTLSRSFSNLSELLEEEEDQMYYQDRIKRLQFPLTAGEHTAEYLQLVDGAVEVQGRLNSLIRRGKSARKVMKRSSSDPELVTAHDRDQPQPGTAPVTADLQATMTEAFSALLQRFSDQPKHDRRRKPRIVSPTTNLNEAFDSLEHDLQYKLQQDEQSAPGGDEVHVDESDREIIKISPQASPKFFKPKADDSSKVHSHSKEETVAILDNIVADIMNAAETAETIKHKSDSSTKPASSKVRRKSAVARIEMNRGSASSSETKRRLSLVEGVPARRYHSSTSILDSSTSSTSSSLSSLHDPMYSSHRGSSLAIGAPPYELDAAEASSTNIRHLVLLSGNRECLHTMVSHMGLPRFAERLVSLAKSPQSSDALLHNIAALIQNIFEGGGAEGRKLAVEAGLLDTIVKLLSAKDPLPGTCLVLLNSLLISDDDNDYLRTIVRIPSDPLLAFLEPSESDIDSGFDNQRDISISITTHSSSDDTVPRVLDPTLLMPPAWTKDRAASFHSVTSDSSSSRSTALSPTLQGHYVTQPEARRIVLKMLAVTSSHRKMKESLREHRTLSLLADYLTNTSHENMTNAVIALANVAQNVSCHHYLLQIGIADRLKPVLEKGPRPRYHALRLLVYLGKLKLNGLSLYDSTGYEVDCITHTSGDHQYVRGATVEKMVELLTGDDSRLLWGGIILPDTSPGHHPSRDRIAEFFLCTYQTFMHPLILMRLLLHRLDTTSSADANPFNWMLDHDSLSPSHLHTIPHHHQAVLNLIHMWLESLPDVFRNTPKLQDYVTELVQRMKRFRGVYTSHAHRLRSLLHNLQHSSHKRTESTTAQLTAKQRIPHHENLYHQCKQLVSGNHLPVTLDQAVFLVALQLHIETLADRHLKQAFFEGMKTKKYPRIFVMHLKQALPNAYIRVKNIAKRTREKMMDFEGMSDRNAKHLYIQQCQSTPGYNCTFYSVKVPSGSKFRRSSQSHVLGISDSHLVLLDDKTKELSSSYLLRDVKKVSHSQTDPCSLSIELEHAVIKLHVDKENAARQIELSLDNHGQRVLESYEQADLDEWDTSWGQHAPSVHTLEDSTSSPGSHDPATGELVETLVAVSNTGAVNTDLPAPPDIEGFSHHLDQDSHELSPQHTTANDECPTEFCNCPPDPEFPLGIDVQLLSLSEILEHPMEIARQLTLLEHTKFGVITREELLQRVNLLPQPSPDLPSATQSLTSASSSSVSSSPAEAGVEKLAYQFNQVANWVAHSVLQYHTPEDRAWAVVQFIEMADHCLKYRNYSSMMAIVVAGLLSPYIRRLKKTWTNVSKPYSEQFKRMETMLSSRNNYKNYREMLDKTHIPAVPFVAIFTRDLRFICDGNPDYLKNGLINLHKRRQVFAKLEEIKHYQSKQYNFEPVPALQDLLQNYKLMTEDELHALSRSVEQDISTPSKLTGRPRSNSISSLTNIVTLKPPLTKMTVRGNSSGNLFL